MVREVNVDASGDHGDQGQEEGVCLKRKVSVDGYGQDVHHGVHVLKMNFSVGVSM